MYKKKTEPFKLKLFVICCINLTAIESKLEEKKPTRMIRNFKYTHLKTAACQPSRLYIVTQQKAHYIVENSLSMMELGYFISFIIIFGLNVLFFFSGLVLNSVVVLSFTDLRNFEGKCVIS